MLITDEYAALNRQLHETNESYGVGGHKWAEQVRQFSEIFKARSILDYGAGKRTLEYALTDLPVRSYDPAVPEIADGTLFAADLVVCTDVLEHVEPELLDNVLDDLRALALRGVFLVVATRPAVKFLADGRNAHLIQKPAEWWLEKIMSRWRLVNFSSVGGGEFVAVGQRLK